MKGGGKGRGEYQNVLHGTVGGGRGQLIFVLIVQHTNPYQSFRAMGSPRQCTRPVGRSSGRSRVKIKHWRRSRRIRWLMSICGVLDASKPDGMRSKACDAGMRISRRA